MIILKIAFGNRPAILAQAESDKEVCTASGAVTYKGFFSPVACVRALDHEVPLSDYDIVFGQNNAREPTILKNAMLNQRVMIQTHKLHHIVSYKWLSSVKTV